MSAGMAGVIAAHVPTASSSIFNLPESGSGRSCRCGLRVEVLHSEMADTDSDAQPYLDHKLAAHVAEELAKAGYGNVQEAKAEALTDAAEVFGAGTWNDVYIMADVEDDADAARATADWLRERAAALTPDPLAAALADPEGHALVKAIHDRKAEA